MPHPEESLVGPFAGDRLGAPGPSLVETAAPFLCSTESTPAGPEHTQPQRKGGPARYGPPAADHTSAKLIPLVTWCPKSHRSDTDDLSVSSTLIGIIRPLWGEVHTWDPWTKSTPRPPQEVEC